MTSLGDRDAGDFAAAWQCLQIIVTYLLENCVSRDIVYLFS